MLVAYAAEVVVLAQGEWMRFLNVGLGVIVWSAGMLLPVSAFAQTAPNDPRINRSGSESLQAGSVKINRAAELNCATSETDIAEIFANSVNDKNNFLIQSINLVDQNGVVIDLKRFKFLADTLAPYTGRQADLRSLQAIAIKAQCALRGNGHLLSAIRVPPQSFERAGADIDLTVVLGRIVNIDYRYGGKSVSGNLDAGTLKPVERRAISRVKSRFAKLTEPGPESDIDLERSVLLATRIPGITVRPTLQKADDMGVGAVNLVVDIFEFDRYQGDLTILNYSPKTLQRWGPLLQVISNSQLVGGDQLRQNE